MTTSKSFITRIKNPLILLVFICLTSGFILLGAHLQMLQGIMPISNLNGLYINMNERPVSMIPIPNTGALFIDECKSALICDDFSSAPMDWTSKGTSMRIQYGALHIVTGLFPKASMVTWNESTGILPETYAFSADMLTSSKYDTAGLAINLQPDGEGTVFLFRPAEQSFFVGQWTHRKLISIIDWKPIVLNVPSANEFHLEIQCTGNQAAFLINGTSSAEITLPQSCNNGSAGIFLGKASWQLWADNILIKALN